MMWTLLEIAAVKVVDRPGHSHDVGYLEHIVLLDGSKNALVGHDHPLIQLLVDLFEGPSSCA